MCLGIACMSKRESSTEYALYNFLLEEYVCIPHSKEIQCDRVKTTTNILVILNLDKKKSLILRNHLVFPKQHVVTLCALVFPVCLGGYLPWRMHCTVFSQNNMCEYIILRKYSVAEYRQPCMFYKYLIWTRRNASICEITLFFLNNTL